MSGSSKAAVSEPQQATLSTASHENEARKLGAAKKSKKQLKIEAAAAAAQAYNEELVAKARARAAAIEAERKAEEDERRRIIEEKEEAERQRLAELRRIAEEEAAELARQKKIEEEKREIARLKAVVDQSRARIVNGCDAAKQANKKWPNRVLGDAPHTALYALYKEVLDLLDTEFPQTENNERDFMTSCKQLIYVLEVESYPTVKDLVNDAEVYVDASTRFQEWFERQTAAGRFHSYDPPPYDPSPAKQLLKLTDNNGDKRGPWTCNACKRPNEPQFFRCKLCGARHGYDRTVVDKMEAKTRAILASKVPEKQRIKRGIQYWLHGQKDGFDYEDYML